MEGFYGAQLVDIEEREGTHGEYWLWKFSIQHRDRTYSLSAFTSTYFTQNARARKWAEAIQRSHIRNGDYFQIDFPKGGICTLAVGIKEFSDGSTANDVRDVQAWRG